MSARPIPALLVALALAGCGKDADAPTGTPAPPPPRTGTVPAAPEREPPRATRPPAVVPSADPLTEETARRAILDALKASAAPEVSRDALLALADGGSIEDVRAAAAPFLAPGEDSGGYADMDRAAIGLQALIRAGDAEAARKAIALAQAAVAADAVTADLVPMLAAIEGPSAAEARRTLVALLDHDGARDEALVALAPLREASAAAAFHVVAADAENEVPMARATAAAALLALRDPKAEGYIESLAAATRSEDPALHVPASVVMAGLSLEGVPDTLPWIRRLAEPALAESDADFPEIAALAWAYADARGPGKGTPEDVAYLRGLMGRDEAADDELVVALWTLGDESHAEAAAAVLSRYVAEFASAEGETLDEDLAVRILDVLGRGRRASKPFLPVIDAAAQLAIPERPKRADAAERVWRIRVAAARAHLVSRKM